MSRLPLAFLFLSVTLCSASAQGGHLGTPQEQQACSRDASRAMACNGSSIDLIRPIAAIKYGSENPGYPL